MQSRHHNSGPSIFISGELQQGPGSGFRIALATAACWCLFVWGSACNAATSLPDNNIPQPPPLTLTENDKDLLDAISRRSFRYFWEQANPTTGLILDRARTDGKSEDNPRHRNVASIAATGFGLTAVCVADEHGWVTHQLARKRVLTTLRFLANQAPQEHGWFYHYMDAATGQRAWHSEVSSIDTALLLAGVLTARQAFADDPEIDRLATAIYYRVDFVWMQDGSATTLRHGWKPETGFLPYSWDTYSELMILYLLAIGSPTHPISPASWYTWKLPVVQMDGYAFIGGGPLFIQQYSQAWVDLRHRVATPIVPGDSFVPHLNYFANAVAATRAQQAAAANMSRQFPGYSSDIWGITASDSVNGYMAWGGSSQDPRIDGTVVPSAAGGSLMFTPDICIRALRTMLTRYGSKIWGRYGFVDAFNPTTGWVSQYVIAIDTGITLLSAENVRTGNVWRWFMSNPEADWALNRVGLVRDPSYTSQEDSKLRAASGRGSDGKSAGGQISPQIPVFWDADSFPSGLDSIRPMYSRQ